MIVHTSLDPVSIFYRGTVLIKLTFVPEKNSCVLCFVPTNAVSKLETE